MRTTAYLGVDIGTSSTKGVLVAKDGTVLRSATRQHEVQRPHTGHVEMDGNVWWAEFCSLADELTGDGEHDVAAVGVSGMGPCLLLTDEEDRPLRPALLYGVDMRALEQIAAQETRYGRDEVFRTGGAHLSTQAIGPKLAWVRDHEPEVFERARQMYMPASWLVRRLTGEYVLDRHSASQCWPMFDLEAGAWHPQWAPEIAGSVELPALRWAGEVAGTIQEQIGGLTPGTPVIAGTIDAWAEATSVGAVNPGDLMLMYGTTMFLIAHAGQPVRHEALWGTLGVTDGAWCLAGGMATSGAITDWLRRVTGSDFATLVDEAEQSGAGARGLLMLPYFAGERTPIMDPQARGVIAGLTVEHTRGDLYRAALEAVAYGVRHNVEALLDSGLSIDRIVAVGGGATTTLWPQVVSDVTGLVQVVPTVTIGASYGGAFLAARAVDSEASIEEWNPPQSVLRPRSEPLYQETYALYRDLYSLTRGIVHHLAGQEIR
ncbi:FGGY-family carbohydrate kinase [Ornithinimicrobium cavernae]|uniref:FGGY-family carbohydrate kinase n=1 Tax=Ornithinimicrobium cavernae TaxID=2666047 RepID=UPI000D68C3FD|nr:FGGY family carbohydrate kinase [Ornithinimicrobium cavernae]